MAKHKRMFRKYDRFRLIGNTKEFVVVKTYYAAGFIPAVEGISKDGYRTCAREADVLKIET